jgi:hypothetical protein
MDQKKNYELKIERVPQTDGNEAVLFYFIGPAELCDRIDKFLSQGIQKFLKWFEKKKIF